MVVYFDRTNRLGDTVGFASVSVPEKMQQRYILITSMRSGVEVARTARLDRAQVVHLYDKLGRWLDSTATGDDVVAWQGEEL